MSRYAWTDHWEAYQTDDKPDTPYAHFDIGVGGISPQLRLPEARVLSERGRNDQAMRIATDRPTTDDAYAYADQAAMGLVDQAVAVLENTLAIGGFQGVRPPLLPDMVTGGLGNPDAYPNHVHKEGPLPAFLRPDCKDELPAELKLEEGTIIVGVVDLGIALGHQRTLTSKGKTRILAAWQQSADRSDIHAETGEAAQEYLPFGRELYAPDIDALITCHTDADGTLDEESFNRACATEDYRALFGQRELGLRASHGMHTLDLAGGLDPDPKEKNPTEQVRLMVTNFPDRALVGHSAAFLEYFAVFAIWRMIRLADAIWDRNNPKACKDPEACKGYPMVINLSFGKQASARDGTDLIALAMKKINAFREGRPEVILSIPAGNENLEQGNSKFVLSGGAEETIDWRISPDDQSANFVEVWAAPVKGPLNQPIEIEVITPDGVSSALTLGDTKSVKNLKVTGRASTRGARDETLVAAIYSDQIGKGGDVFSRSQAAADQGQSASKTFRQRYVIAVKQTLIYEDGVQTAPAGVWRIKLRNRLRRNVRVELNVQTDQSANPVTAINQRSYFEHPAYVRFDETGRKIDSYSYPERDARPEPRDSSNVLRRHGTLNAVGIGNATATVAGHRASDGRPEPYSSTGLPGRAFDPEAEDDDAPRNGDRREQPSVSFPSRDGAAHFGVLSSGSRDGSSAAFQGTSFAAAMATRRIWRIMLEEVSFDQPEAVETLKSKAEKAESKAKFPGKVAAAKSGKGRLQHPCDRTLRMGRSAQSRFGIEP